MGEQETPRAERSPPALADCVLRLATDAQLVAFNTAMHDIFYEGHPVSREQLDKSFVELSASPTRTTGLCLTWALVARNNPEGEVYTFADTLRRDVWTRQPDGAIGKGVLYSIQSVCTPRAYRRRGYGRALLRKLHYLLAVPGTLPPASPGLVPLLNASDAEMLPPALASVLSSDLAPGWYEKCTMGYGEGERPGWVTVADHSNSDFYMPLDRVPDVGQRDGVPLPLRRWHHTFMYQRELDDLAPLLSLAFRMRLANEPDTDKTLLIPDPEMSGWLHHLEIFDRVRVSKLKRGPVPQDTPVGVRFFHGPSTTPYEPTDPLVLFLPNGFTGLPYFPLTMISHLPPDLLAEVFRIVVPLAREAGNTDIRAWGIEPEGELARRWLELGGRMESRAESRKNPYGLAWYGDQETKGDLIGCEMWAFT